MSEENKNESPFKLIPTITFTSALTLTIIIFILMIINNSKLNNSLIFSLVLIVNPVLGLIGSIFSLIFKNYRFLFLNILISLSFFILIGITKYLEYLISLT